MRWYSNMSALHETTTGAAEEHVLRTFARHEATTISASLLLDESGPFTRSDIARALAELEHRERALLRYTWDGTEWVTLTLLGVARRGGAPAPPAAERRINRAATAPQIIYEHPHRFRSDTHEYSAFILGVERTDGTWAGWIEFVPFDGVRRLRTGQETSQSNRDALYYWATGLEDVYFDGALSRASA